MVRHATGSYAVIVRSGGVADLAGLIDERHPGARAVVIADSTVAGILASPLPSVPVITFAAGESHKTRDSWNELTDQLLDARYDRRTVIVAFGGGVTTDLAGFVAATYLRGVPWIAVPTTTLAMLDAAIGGKTGVDTAAGKNLVGAFHPPTAVICDPMLLRSLPEASFREGLAEAVKHAATLDEKYGGWIAQHAAAIMDRDQQTLEQLIRRSLELKAEIVAGDEHEADRRAVLNAGHTVAHALERASEYTMPHGEAVAIGLVLETRVAERLGIARAGTADQIAALLQSLGLPTIAPHGLGRERIADAMQADKKNRDGVVHAAFISSFGQMAGGGEVWTLPLDLAVLSDIL